MSTPGSAATGPGQPASSSTEQPYFFPAGLQLLYDVEKTNVRSLKHAFFLVTHWIMTRGGLRRTTTELNLPGSYETRRAVTTFDETPTTVSASPTEPTGAQVLAAITEIPEPGWADKIDGVQEGPVIFTYMNPLALEEGYYKLEFYALNDTDMIVRMINPHGPAARKQFLEKKPDMVHGQVDNRSSGAASYVMSDFVRFGEEYTTALGIFFKASLLEKTVFRNLFERLGLPVNGPIPKSIGIYDDKVPERATENRTRDARSEYYRDEPNPYRPNYPRRPMPDPGGVGGPLYAPPVGIGGLGRSDLDPLGGVGAGMLADPRGFRRTGPPAYPLGGGPGRLPPGARFDPFGPVGPGQAPFPGPPAPGRNPGQFAGPNPDHEQPPPGFEDMFM